MKLAISYKFEEWRKAVESESALHVSKLDKLLKHYSPDLIQLHGSVEKYPRKEQYAFTLNLSLPTGTLHATGEGSDVRACIKEAFADIDKQVKKHKDLLRKDHEWKRKRPRSGAMAKS